MYVHEMDGWAGTKDIELYAKARLQGFQAITTNDARQLNRPMEVEATARSGLHCIQYRENNKHGGLVGLGTAIASVCAALPHTLAELEEAHGQRLVSLTAVDLSRRSRLQVTDPAVELPKHWPGR
ncbi:hypothetical protein WB401_31620 [Streptomyces brasiliscabiei]|uniref:VapC45 PIN like domain-containing protein n=1 Tax=Streptomyces brasiliscabiei TaxID=2736302 RepID=A0ABU8GE89_9ACTN